MQETCYGHSWRRCITAIWNNECFCTIAYFSHPFKLYGMQEKIDPKEKEDVISEI